MLEKISPEEIFYMKEFVKTNFRWNQAAYTLYFSNKPVSLSVGIIECPNMLLEDRLWLKGFNYFVKNNFHSKEFSENFICNWYETTNEHFTVIDLFIINKKSLKHCLKIKSNLFKSILGEDFNYESFILQLENQQPLEKIIKHSQVLLGVLLGFGEESSIAFENHQKQKWGHFFLRTDVYAVISPTPPIDCPCEPIAFMGNPTSSEVLDLVSIYKKEMEIFWDIYQKKDPLIFFLEGICEADIDYLPISFYSRWKSGVEFSYFVINNPLSVNFK
ncbi:MAG: hypothetical protein WC222_02880 [Parachlamydiales bacterium]|jgi:hypothetical protein